MDYAPMLSRKSLAERLEALAGQAGRVKDYDIMVREAVLLYHSTEEVASLAGLSVGWHQAGLEQVRGLDMKLQRVVERALLQGVVLPVKN